MAIPQIQPAFTAGEVAPSLFGRTDLAREHVAASTMRNMFVRHTGGAFSRAGTAFVGFSRQTGRSVPPRLITFQFSINQGRALEFGNFYMRPIVDGAFVVENPSAITGATQASPCVLTVTAALGATAATPDNTNVASTYAPGDTVTLKGGMFSDPTVLGVTSTAVAALTIDTAATSGVYAPGDTITLQNGTATTKAQVTVSHTQVVKAAIVSAGSGGTPGSGTITGTTGTGTKFQAAVTIGSDGSLQSIDAITVPGNYTANPTVPSVEPVSGNGLASATVNLTLGVLRFSISRAGVYTKNPVFATFTQAATSGAGVGASFKNAVMGIAAVSVQDAGVYTSYPANPVKQASSSGAGTGARFTVTTGSVSAFNVGDWIFIADVVGMSELNGQSYVVGAVTATTVSLNDVYGNPVDSTGFTPYVSGGTASRLYTLTTPWAEADLRWLKFTQSADTMTICCVNQLTGTEYAPQNLIRNSDTDWELSDVIPDSSIDPPANLQGVASGTGKIDYQYVVTAISAKDGTESVASNIAEIDAAVDIASTAGSITLTWDAVLGASSYNVYKASPGYQGAPPVGALFGYAGTTLGTQFSDTNIVADLTFVPPTHKNPFARGQVSAANVVSGGSGYTTVTLSITSATGSGAVLEGVLVDGALSAILVTNAGEGYTDADTITVAGDGDGAGASLTIGPQTGTYPSVVTYFQQRRVFANTLNNPDTYFMSQPGAFGNFDTRIPDIDTDAVTGSPWSLQVNGIQFMLPTAGGLLVLTGLSEWLLVGTGSFAINVQPVSPSSQLVSPQPENGCSPTVFPIKINYDVLYLSAKGSCYYDLPYQLYTLSEPIDLTQLSPHLFLGFTILEHAWCEQPYKLLWAVRDDGALLSLTFLKQQSIAGWARHDTNGLWQSVCAVTEPPVDALYACVERFPGTNTAYMIERMDNRIWGNVEQSWCVDCGLSLAQPAPNATLSASSATGAGQISGATDLIGGSGYSSAATATVIDDNGQGPGSGATATLTIAGGIITAIAVTPGSGYVRPALVISDPAHSGSGASATLTLDNSATFTASANVFSAGDVGSVIRMGGGIAAITTFISAKKVTANIVSPIVQVIPNSNGVPAPQAPGQWTLTAPAASVSGLMHLAGATVTGLYDGQVIPPTVVPATGQISLPAPASSVVVGLGFTAQVQSVYLEGGNPTVQGQRKKIAAVTARVEASGAFEVGCNQPDGSVQSPMQLAPAWDNLAPAVTGAVAPYGSNLVPLFTGDVRVPVTGGFNTKGQAAVQQQNPLPLNLLAFISEGWQGDLPQNLEPRRQRAA